MEFLKDRRLVLILLGGAVAVAAGIGGAAWLAASGRGAPAEAPPASQGGLVVETGDPDEGRLDPARPLRCFVAGQYVGDLTLAECAQRNGVATGALDVGLDESGALAAAGEAGTMLTPLPPEEVTSLAPAPAPTPAPATGSAAAPQAPVGTCWRYADGRWRDLPGETTLNACVQTLFAGRCERPGAATYGRWGQQTLRLVAGKVEISGDNRSFRTLVEQGPGCALPTVG
ncbi:MAG: hypothetical protein ACK41C_14175 [Phenylobacterium sp.]|uniref:hypothetical protein n=1 Tax=Phenylobacterium sp. TaxID=1871053 RepID=UPI003918D9AC